MDFFHFFFILTLSTIVMSQNTTIPVNFWLFTKDNLDEYEVMEFDGFTVTLVPDTLFDPTKQTKVVVHGFGGEIHIDEKFAAAYANAGLDYNIIGVDWRDIQGIPQQQVQEVGVYTAHFLQALAADHGLILQDAHPIGWSFGAHVVGSFEIRKLSQCCWC